MDRKLASWGYGEKKGIMEERKEQKENKRREEKIPFHPLPPLGPTKPPTEPSVVIIVVNSNPLPGTREEEEEERSNHQKETTKKKKKKKILQSRPFFAGERVKGGTGHKNPGNRLLSLSLQVFPAPSIAF